MRKFTLVSSLILAAAMSFGGTALAQTGASKAAAAPARKADEFVIHTNEGPDKLLSSYKGKVVVMAFMYTTCPHCQHTAGVLAKIQTEYAAKGVQVLGTVFDVNARQGLANFVKVTGANFPVGYASEDLVKKFMHVEGDYYVPMLAFIDKAGMIRTTIISKGDPNGAADKFLADQENTIRKEIDKYLKPAAAAAPKAAPKN